MGYKGYSKLGWKIRIFTFWKCWSVFFKENWGYGDVADTGLFYVVVLQGQIGSVGFQGAMGFAGPRVWFVWYKKTCVRGTLHNSLDSLATSDHL